LMIKSHSIIWIVFLAVYGVDVICTILHRIYLKQNIFEAHRLHFYQILSNEKGVSHLKISFLYALVQGVICSIIIYSYHYFKSWEWIIAVFIILILSFIYLLKFRYIPKN
ncbi:MAG: UDP-GlcNAc--UDP-phosphate GlcNAc-1-phosphate transferase, partial [Dysgonamonadaceae bacterium]|nr:UDP-GlcNAc--UDP-phosphate GlcNAc-1-phosphate transferase [Dysgonamonadaceae bacterium]